MKRSKNFLVLLVLLCLICAVALVSCDEGGDPSSGGNGGTQAEQSGNGGNSHTHEWGEWTVTKPATCQAKGSKTRICACGAEETGDVVVDPTAHAFDQMVIDAQYLKSQATQSAPAYYYYSCLCGAQGSNTFAYGGALPTPVSSITLNQTTATVDLGGSLNLVATILPANATDKTVVWTTSDASVATVVNGAVSTRDIGTAADLLGLSGKLCNCGIHSLEDTLAKHHGVCTCGNVLHALVNESLRKKGCGGRSVTCRIVSLGCYLANETCAHIFSRIVKLDFLCDGNTVVGDKGSAELLVKHYVSALRTESYFYGVCKLINSAKQSASCFHSVKNFLCHNYVFLLIILPRRERRTGLRRYN